MAGRAQRPARGTIVLSGSLAQKPGRGGHTWVFLQYLLGFRRLGWDVLFVDWLNPAMCVDAAGRPASLERSTNVEYAVAVMERFGLADSYLLLDKSSGRTIGISRHRALERIRSSSLLLNVMGYLDDEELLAAAPRRVFLDIDPGFPQMWRALGLHDAFAGHDYHVTIGENVGRAECPIPTCGLDWITTPQPVVLEAWPAQTGNGGRFTSVGAWRGQYGTLEYDGKTYGQRVHEFRKFAELPRLSGGDFELALQIDEGEVGDLSLLAAGGWGIVDPQRVAGDPWAYRRYIQESKAEVMVAKNIYVDTACGWFSDRSICYLASGRPVLAQDTGLRELYPSGEGLMLFSTLDDALAGVEDVSRSHARHARAARALAEDRFDSDKVLARLLDRLGVAP